MPRIDPGAAGTGSQGANRFDMPPPPKSTGSSKERSSGIDLRNSDDRRLRRRRASLRPRSSERQVEDRRRIFRGVTSTPPTPVLLDAPMLVVDAATVAGISR